MGKWLIPRARASSYKLSLEYDALPESKEVLKDEWGYIKVTVNATGQIYHHLSIKINIDSIRL